MDINDEKELSYTEFLAAFLNLDLVEDEAALLRAFHIFDVDADGYVSKKDLETAFTNMDCARMLEEVGCHNPEGMDFGRFSLMVLQPAKPLNPPRKRVQLEDNDIGGGWEVIKRNNLSRTASMFDVDLQRSMSMIRPP